MPYVEQLLVELVSAYRYEEPKPKDDATKSEAEVLAHIIKSTNNKRSLVDDDEVIKILSTRSKPHLNQLYEQYKNISNKNLDEVIILKKFSFIQWVFLMLNFFSLVRNLVMI